MSRNDGHRASNENAALERAPKRVSQGFPAKMNKRAKIFKVMAFLSFTEC